MQKLPFFLDSNQITFPDPETALYEPNGLLAVGGDLSAKRLIEAYKNGIFPWFSEGSPILWWSPNPRAVLFLDELKISRSLRQTLKKNLFTVTMDQAFENVIQACAAPRKTQAETWISPEMIDAYCELHRLGYAHSVEVWLNDVLVGGLYGIVIYKVFCGESMFSLKPNASKVALVYLVNDLIEKKFHLIDCQMMNPHLASLGAREIPREQFLQILQKKLVSN